MGTPFVGIVGIIIIALGIILVIAWIVLPFAVLGTKPLLERLLRETEETNRLLRQLRPPTTNDAVARMDETNAAAKRRS